MAGKIMITEIINIVTIFLIVNVITYSFVFLKSFKSDQDVAILKLPVNEYFAFFYTSTLRCVLQHLIFLRPLSDLAREIFGYEIPPLPFSGIMIYFFYNFNCLR